MLAPFLACLGLKTKRQERVTLNTKPSYEPKYTDEDPATDVERAAARFVDVLLVAGIVDSTNQDLEANLKDSIGTYSWTESLAKAILVKLEELINSGASMGSAMKVACEKACEAATGFAREHPVYTTLIALGILCILAPWVLEVLGFAELGPIEGKCIRDLRQMTNNAIRTRNH